MKPTGVGTRNTALVLGTMVVPLVAGSVQESFGIEAVFHGAAIAAGLGTLVAWYYVRKRAHGRRLG